MADGDIFRNGLGVYKKLYEWLCENKASMSECTQIAIKALKQDLKKKGDLPIKLAQDMGERLSQILSIEGENKSVDWGIANREIEKILQVDGRHDVKELILCAGKSFLRRQALGAARIEDKTRYLILHGNYLPAKDPSESLRNMLTQVDTLRCLLVGAASPLENRSHSYEVQWEALTRKFPILDDIVDRCHIVEKLTIVEMQNKLIRLYQNYVTEWDDVKSQLSVNII